jgi:hypothetical protein
MDKKKYESFTINKAANGFLLDADYKLKPDDEEYNTETERWIFFTVDEMVTKLKELLS